MKTVILCGGLGTRISEETSIKPKPMIEIGGNPILWNIMKTYERHGFNDFVLALGYKGHIIKDYFSNYNSRNSDFTINTKTGIKHFDSIKKAEDWNVDLIDTGKLTLTGGRILRLKDKLKETFFLTYGDGVCNVDLNKLLDFHKSHGKVATVTAVRPPARFGGMKIEKNQVKEFKEKPQIGEASINGGYFVFEPEIFNYIKDDNSILEKEPLETLSRENQLMAYEHNDFWHCMDTIRDRDALNNFIKEGYTPWLG
jgi:glucose-1-phosphate cytidylyltransferase|tara:strand:- start:7030 stop:7794 length:765 start_codon:yes stop_codon:yes gene_type:complete